MAQFVDRFLFNPAAACLVAVQGGKIFFQPVHRDNGRLAAQLGFPVHVGQNGNKEINIYDGDDFYGM